MSYARVATGGVWDDFVDQWSRFLEGDYGPREVLHPAATAATVDPLRAACFKQRLAWSEKLKQCFATEEERVAAEGGQPVRPAQPAPAPKPPTTPAPAQQPVAPEHVAVHVAKSEFPWAVVGVVVVGAALLAWSAPREWRLR